MECKLRIGLFYAVLGCFSIVFADIFSYDLTKKISTISLVCLRYTGYAFIFLPWFIKKYQYIQDISLKNWFYLSIFVIFSVLTTVFAVASLSYLGIANMIVLLNLQPVISAIIAYFWLREVITYMDVTLLICTVAGVIIACQPTFLFDSTYTFTKGIGSLFGLLSALATSFTIIFGKKLSDMESGFIFFAQGAFAAIFCYVLALVFQSFKAPLADYNWLYLFLYCFFSTSGRALLILAVRTEDANLISTLICLEVPFAFIMQIIFFNMIPNSATFIGGAMVLCGTSLLAGKKYISRAD